MDTSERLSVIAADYDSRARAVLSAIRDELVSEGWKVSEPYDMHCDDYRWCIYVSRVDANPDEIRDDDIDITLQLLDARDYDGPDAVAEGVDGMSWCIDIVEVGGRILGGLTPYNYTSDVWVDVNDSEAVEDRFSMIETVSPSAAASQLDR